MSLVFYYSPMSTAVVTHWVLEELGIPHEKVKLDFATDTKKPDFLKLNPNGAVPVIVHDGTPIFESAAIAIYLGETFGVEKGLFPAAGPERGRAMGWIVWANVTFGGAVGRYNFVSSERVPAEQRNAEAAKVGRAEVEKLFKLLDGVLEGKQWIVGDSFSIADAHVAAFVSYTHFLGFDTKPYASLEAWRARATSRPAYAKVMQPG